MLKPLCLISLLLLAPLAVAQVNAPPASPESGTEMKLPPPVSRLGFPTRVGSLEMSNYFRAGLVFSGGYAHNLYPGTGGATVDDATFSLQPTFSLDHTSARNHTLLRYTPTFDYYDPDNTLNTINQAGEVALQYRLAPYATLLIGDRVTKTSNTWSQPLSSGTVTGGLPPTTPGFIAPFAPQVSNNAYAQLTWQFALNSMVGFGGDTTLLDFTNPSKAQGLFNSNSRSGSAFYSHRIRARQYFGGLYQYSLIEATPVTSSGPSQTNLEANNFLGFYTIYPQSTLSISFGGGSQHYDISQSQAVSARSWEPIAVASIGWQVLGANFALSYNHVVTEGQGVVGAYTSDAGNLSTQLRVSPNWLAGFGGSYAQIDPVTSGLAGSMPGGHTLSFNGSLARQLGANLSLSFQYQYLHQTYSGIPSIAVNPTSSRGTVSISYHFARPLGR